jgi:hypothetical protein
MKFSYYTIIGKDADMIRGHLSNVVHHAGYERMECDKELIIVVYRNANIPKEVTEEISDVCTSYGAKIVYFDEPPGSTFLDNLYACWNLGYVHSDEGWVFRSGSDQAFNHDSFPKLYDVAMRMREKDSKILLNSNTIEHSVRTVASGNHSRHILANFGDSFNEFNVDAFEEFCKKLNENVVEELLTVEESIKYWGRPLPFRSTINIPHNRTEGCSWLITKEDWRIHGPMIPITHFPGWGSITGDCFLHDKLELAGYKDYLTRDCITYHFFRGESIQRYGYAKK